MAFVDDVVTLPAAGPCTRNLDECLEEFVVDKHDFAPLKPGKSQTNIFVQQLDKHDVMNCHVHLASAKGTFDGLCSMS